MDVVAIDFETANGNASSACQLAATVVRESEIIEEHVWLIRPPRMFFSPRNISIHGIRPQDVKDAPTMEQVWSEFAKIIDGQVLVAHNARFDIGVLVASLAAHDVACPDLQFTCTRLLARSAWPGRARYGLKPLGDWLGVSFRHHDALEDARCCASIALAVEQQHQQTDLAALEKSLRVTRGSYRQSVITSPRAIGRRHVSVGAGRQSTDRWGFPNQRSKPGSIDPQAVVVAAAQQKPFEGKRLVLLGPLRGLSLQESQALVSSLGGVVQTQITAATDYVVACGTSLDDASRVLCAAVANAADDSGEPNSPSPASTGIRLLSERQFRALMPAGKSSARW